VEYQRIHLTTTITTFTKLTGKQIPSTVLLINSMHQMEIHVSWMTRYLAMNAINLCGAECNLGCM
jgi:hypothetical protein